MRHSTGHVRNLFNGGGQIGGLNDGEARNRQGRRHERSIASFHATGLWIADLHRIASNSHHRAFGPQFCVLYMGSVPDVVGRTVVALPVSISDCDELGHGLVSFQGV